LAIAARREATDAMSRSQWVHIFSLELGWMAPGQARAYIDACADAGLLVGGDRLSLSFAPAEVVIPRGFRPDPSELPTPAEVPRQSVGAPTREVAPARVTPTRVADAQGFAHVEPPCPSVPAAMDGAVENPLLNDDIFGSLLPLVAAAKQCDVATIVGEVEVLQARLGGHLSAEAALLTVAQAAGMDVRAAAGQALRT
jgi:hypothetical protein